MNILTLEDYEAGKKRIAELEAERDQLREENSTAVSVMEMLREQRNTLADQCDQLREENTRLKAPEPPL